MANSRDFGQVDPRSVLSTYSRHNPPVINWDNPALSRDIAKDKPKSQRKIQATKKRREYIGLLTQRQMIIYFAYLAALRACNYDDESAATAVMREYSITAVTLDWILNKGIKHRWHKLDPAYHETKREESDLEGSRQSRQVRLINRRFSYFRHIREED